MYLHNVLPPKTRRSGYQIVGSLLVTYVYIEKLGMEVL